MEKLLGFLPDADPTTAGIVQECTNIVPGMVGMEAAPTPAVISGLAALAAECRGAAVVTKLDSTRRIFAGTQTKLYELSGSSWTDVSAGSYTGGTESIWSICQFGDATLASNGADAIQRSNGSGAFAAIATAPKAKIVFTVGSFVMALATNDGTYGDQPDRWWCCASFDDTLWTPSVSTLATTGRLVATPGRIVAGGKLGEYAIAYKERSMFIGQFVGAPSVFNWTPVPGGDAGCVGIDAWCDIGGAHLCVGQEDIFLFDGSRPAPIGVGEVRDWFYRDIHPAYKYKTKCVYNSQKKTVWIFYCSGSSILNKALVYNIATKQWGSVSIGIEAALNYVSNGITIDTIPGSTIDSVTTPFDSQYWFSGGRELSVFNSSHQLNLMNGQAASSSITTWDMGDDEFVSLLSRVRVRFAEGLRPAATISLFKKMNEGDAIEAGATGTLIDGKFDVIQSARFHKARIDFVGPVRVLAFGAQVKQEGRY